MLHDIQQRFTPAILGEALQRFGFAPEPLLELEGSAFVYEGLVDRQPRILKIAPGIWNSDRQLTGSTLEQLLAEVDFVRYLAENGLPVARPVLSRSGNWVERLPLDDQACFLAYTFEKAPGEMYPDADEVHFSKNVMVAWGHLCGRLHHLSAAYQPHPERRRLPWHANDLLDFPALIPPEQTLVYRNRDELLTRLNALPQDTESYGLVHGDFHHGNFLIDGEKLTLFDFDAAEYFWYTGEICTALYNCLPLPRHEIAKRRLYALNYLHHFLRGYRQEREFSDFWLTQIPLFLKYCELLNYAYFHKYWDLSNLTPRRAQVLADLRHRIEQEIPVVAFDPGDL